MATLTLPPAGNTITPDALVNPLFVSEGLQSRLTVCLLLSTRPQAGAAIKLGSYAVNLHLQDGFLGLKDYVLSELVGARPYIYLKFTDGHGIDLSDEIFVGRGSQVHFSADLFLQALALANLAAAICPVHNGVLLLAGLNAVFSFRNFPTGAHTVEDMCSVALLARAAHALSPEEANSAASLPRIISLQLMQGGRPVGTAVSLGRCP